MVRVGDSPRTRALAVAASTAAVLVLATGGARAADIGANDDTPKFAADAGEAFFRQMAEAGLEQTVLTLRWRPTRPLEIPLRIDLERTIAAAEAQGLRVVLATYPYPPAELELGLGTPAEFGAWLTEVATAFPTVKAYVVLNEPNQPAFLRPQFDEKGANVSAARAGELLAAGYDALKAVDPAITVIGIGLSPRGNDRPAARSNISTSPVRFIRALGDWYRSSGRTKPLMDAFSFHPYPNRATDPLDRGYPWPNAGFANLDRIRQALWDAFAGTSQPTTLDGLRISLNEVGWQVDTGGLAGYTGDENVPVTTEEAQSTVYADLVRRALCDPDIAQVNVFGFWDDGHRGGFQSALNRLDGTPRPSSTAVTRAIGETVCAVPARWRPSTTVAGASSPTVRHAVQSLTVTVAAAEGATALACTFPGRVGALSMRYRLARADPASPSCRTVALAPNRPGRLVVPRPSLRAWTLGVRLVAETNARRSVTWVP